MDARDRSRDNAMYEAENDQLIGRLIELERLTSVVRLIQTLIVLLEWLIPLLEDVRISRNNLDIIAMLKDTTSHTCHTKDGASLGGSQGTTWSPWRTRSNTWVHYAHSIFRPVHCTTNALGEGDAEAQGIFIIVADCGMFTNRCSWLLPVERERPNQIGHYWDHGLHSTSRASSSLLPDRQRTHGTVHTPMSSQCQTCIGTTNKNHDFQDLRPLQCACWECSESCSWTCRNTYGATADSNWS